jgi:hypothetical protein
MKISIVLMYCSNDFRWIKACVEQASKIAEEIVIPVCDHFFDGTPENREVLDKTYEMLSSNPKVKIIEYEYSPGRETSYWDLMSRVIGKENTNPENDWIMYLESDEIIESDKFIEWINTGEYKNYESMKFDNYFYFRESIYQADQTKYEDSVVLVKRKYANINPLLKIAREQCHEYLNVNKKRNIRGLDGKPMIHHFSWVRTKEQMLRKVKSWFHNKDMDWVSLVEKEFSQEFSGVDFIPAHNYSYKVVENKFNL